MLRTSEKRDAKRPDRSHTASRRVNVQPSAAAAAVPVSVSEQVITPGAAAVSEQVITPGVTVAGKSETPRGRPSTVSAILADYSKASSNPKASPNPKASSKQNQDNSVRITFPLYVLPSAGEHGLPTYDRSFIEREYHKAVQLFLGIKQQVVRQRPGGLSSCFGELKLYLVPYHFLDESPGELESRNLEFLEISSQIREQYPQYENFIILNFESDMTDDYRAIFDMAKQRDEYIRIRRKPETPTYSNRLGAEILDFIKLESDFLKTDRVVPALHVVMDTSIEIIDYSLFVSSWVSGNKLKLQVYVNAYSNDPLYFTLVNKLNVLPRDPIDNHISPVDIRKNFKSRTLSIFPLMADQKLWKDTSKDQHNMFYREVYLESYRAKEFLLGSKGAAVDMQKVKKYINITKSIVSNKTQSWKGREVREVSVASMRSIQVTSIFPEVLRTITLSLTIVNATLRKYRTAMALEKKDMDSFEKSCCHLDFDMQVISCGLDYLEFVDLQRIAQTILVKYDPTPKQKSVPLNPCRLFDVSPVVDKKHDDAHLAEDNTISSALSTLS